MLQELGVFDFFKVFRGGVRMHFEVLRDDKTSVR